MRHGGLVEQGTQRCIWPKLPPAMSSSHWKARRHFGVVVVSRTVLIVFTSQGDRSHQGCGWNRMADTRSGMPRFHPESEKKLRQSDSKAQVFPWQPPATQTDPSWSLKSKNPRVDFSSKLISESFNLLQRGTIPLAYVFTLAFISVSLLVAVWPWENYETSLSLTRQSSYREWKLQLLHSIVVMITIVLIPRTIT